MKVTEFAKRAGVGPDVVRYYVREGLLAPSRNPANGYKLFGSPHLARIRFIRQVQALGFTLSEIRDLMARMDAGDCPCEDMREQLRDQDRREPDQAARDARAPSVSWSAPTPIGIAWAMTWESCAGCWREHDQMTYADAEVIAFDPHAAAAP